MEGTVFTVMVLSGLLFLPVSFPCVYTLVKKSKTWHEARNYCRLKHTDLASAENAEEMQNVVKAAQEFYYGHIWIGLHHKSIDWKWSLEQEGYYGAGETEFRSWRHTEPNDTTHGRENCVFTDGNGFWADLRCSDRLPFVCTTGNPASPTFIAVNNPMTWSEAQSYCRQNYTDLASVRNQTENDLMRSVIPNQYHWIGLHREAWMWSDGSPVSFTQWHSGTNEPNGGINTPCVLLHEAQWEDRICEKHFYFLCYTATVWKKVVRVSIASKDSSENLEDAADAVLQKLNQRMKDRGRSEDVKLRWRKQPDGKIFHKENEETEENTCSLP